LGVRDLPAEGRHDRLVALHHLRRGVEDGLADVALVDAEPALVRLLLLAEDALPRRADESLAGRRVAGYAPLRLGELLSLIRRDVARALLARRHVLVAGVADALHELVVVLLGLDVDHRVHRPVPRRLAGWEGMERVVARRVRQLPVRALAASAAVLGA